MCETAKTENSNQNQYIKTVENIGILYEDPHILVCHKPAGIPVQSANARVKDMVSILKLYLQEQSGQPGEPYLGVVHRLDQPVQGVILFAKTKQAAANLSEQVAKRKDSGQVVKRYCAVVHRNPKVYKEGKKTAEYQELTDYLQRDRRTNTSYIVPKLSGAGMPIVGDKKYTSLEVTKREGKAKEMPALCAYSLSFCHPETGKQMDFTVKPEGGIFDKFRKNDQE